MPKVETSTPLNTPAPIGPYSHVAKAGSFISIGGAAGGTVIGVSELPKPGVLLTMN